VISALGPSFWPVCSRSAGLLRVSLTNAIHRVGAVILADGHIIFSGWHVRWMLHAHVQRLHNTCSWCAHPPSSAWHIALQGGNKLTAQSSVALGPAPPDLATAARVLADQTQFVRTSDGVQLVRWCRWCQCISQAAAAATPRIAKVHCFSPDIVKRRPMTCLARQGRQWC
jgi:hypothetical protein